MLPRTHQGLPGIVCEQSNISPEVFTFICHGGISSINVPHFIICHSKCSSICNCLSQALSWLYLSPLIIPAPYQDIIAALLLAGPTSTFLHKHFNNMIIFGPTQITGKKLTDEIQSDTSLVVLRLRNVCKHWLIIQGRPH